MPQLNEVPHPTVAVIRLDHLAHNMRLLKSLVSATQLWPAVKANAYGHGASLIARHLVELGYHTLCVAHASEAIALLNDGIQATYLLLSPTLPENAALIAEYEFQPVVCTEEMLAALSIAASERGNEVAVHLKVDTGMGRVGIRPDQVETYVRLCDNLPGIRLCGIMSHFPCADSGEESLSCAAIEQFTKIVETTQDSDIGSYHLANSAGIFDLAASHFDAARPGISIYGLRPSDRIVSRKAEELRPVLEWKTQITFLKEVPEGTGLSYGHSYRTANASLIATIPVGYGDGLSRRLSNQLEVLIHGGRCPQVGQITMDQSLIDVSHFRDRINLGDEVVLIGKQGDKTITADELAGKLGTINYEITTAISNRVPRVPWNAV